MGKRAANEGSISQQGDGYWRAVLRLPSGKRIYRRSKTQQGALKALEEMRTEYRTFSTIAPRAATVSALLDAWLEASGPRLKPESLRKYKTHVAALSEILGRLRAADLQPGDVRMLHHELAARKMSPTTIGHVHATLRTAINWAVREGTLPRNVAAAVPLPKRSTEESKPLTRKELEPFLRGLKGHPQEVRIRVALLGLRQGEALAMRWSDVDLTGGLLHVRGSLSRTPEGLKVLGTKTARSRRSLALPERLKTLLKERAAESESEWVFPGKTPDVPLHPAADWRRIKAAYKDLEVRDTRVHDLRHSTAVLLRSAGLPMDEISDQLGHASVAITHTVYAHVDDGQRHRAAKALDDLDDQDD